MAKKKDAAILANLHALKPNIPTKTRKESTDQTTQKDAAATSVVEKSPPHAVPESFTEKQSLTRPEQKSARTVAPAETASSGRKESLLKKYEKKDIVIKEEEPGLVNIMAKNMEAAERVNGLLLTEMEKIHDIIVDTWTRSLYISFDIARMNFEYLVEVIFHGYGNEPDR